MRSLQRLAERAAMDKAFLTGTRPPPHGGLSLESSAVVIEGGHPHECGDLLSVELSQLGEIRQESGRVVQMSILQSPVSQRRRAFLVELSGSVAKAILVWTTVV